MVAQQPSPSRSPLQRQADVFRPRQAGILRSALAPFPSGNTPLSEYGSSSQQPPRNSKKAGRVARQPPECGTRGRSQPSLLKVLHSAISVSERPAPRQSA